MMSSATSGRRLILRHWRHLLDDSTKARYLPMTALKRHFTVTDNDDCEVCGAEATRDAIVYELLDNRALPTHASPSNLDRQAVVVALFDSRRVHPSTQGILYAAVQTGRLRLVAARPEDEAILQQLNVPFDPLHRLVSALLRPDHQRYVSGLKMVTLLTQNRRYDIVDGDIFKIFLTDHVHIFVMSGARAAHFFTHVRPVTTTPFVLVTHNSDENIDERYLALVDGAPNMLAWFAENLCLPPGSCGNKLHCLPMGIANSGWPHGDMDALAAAVAAEKSVTHTRGKVYLGCDVSTNVKERQPLKDRFSERHGWQNQRQTYRDYLQHLSSAFEYCFCPAGVGVDTHRFWECLYLGVCPIVKRSAWSAHWRGRVPMIEVDDWNDFDNLTDSMRIAYTANYDVDALDVRCHVDRVVASALQHPRVTSIYTPLLAAYTHIHACVVSNRPDNQILRQMQRDAHDLGWPPSSFHVLAEPGMKIGHGVGHGAKVLLMQKFLASLCRERQQDDSVIVLFMDAHDVRLLGRPTEVVARFKKTRTRILFSAEKNCWPDADRAAQFVASSNASPYRYLNSGGYIGYAKDLVQLLKDNANVFLDYATDDQRYFTTLFLRHQHQPERVKLDTRCELFQSLFLAHADVCPASLQNKACGTRPLIFHGNGGNAEGDPFFNQIILTRRVDPVSSSPSDQVVEKN